MKKIISWWGKRKRKEREGANRALKSPKIEPSLLIPEILSSKHTAKLQVEETLKGGGKGR